jgi:hypothetical protein
MTRAGEQNDLDLQRIVAQINSVFAETISFVYLPGDVADDGSRSAYRVVRESLDQLEAPWCAIVGDHDVHEKSFANFLEFMSDRTHYAFSVGSTRFLAMNAFDIPEPPSFTVFPAQSEWAERELGEAAHREQSSVLLLHCYPSDLKSGGDALTGLLHRFRVRLVDMGHTHYNEIANDGRTLYAATRSTGQIEEGPAGFSVVNVDSGVVSWRFTEPGQLPFVMITSPADERLQTQQNPALGMRITVRAKVWSDTPIVAATAVARNIPIQLICVEGSQVWQGNLDLQTPPEPDECLRVEVRDAVGRTAQDAIRLPAASQTSPNRAARDQDNAIPAWPEHGLLGTQLGPNKNGKKW